MPRVSVILPTKNRPELLARSLESLARQTYKDFEVVLIVDGDGIDLDVTEGLNVHVHSAPAGVGVSRCRNLGIRVAQGEWIAYLDDDDIWLPNHLETLISSVGMGFPLVYTDSLLEKDGERKLYMSMDFDRNAILSNNITPIINVLHQREGCGFFDESMVVLEDWDFLIRLSRKWNFLHVPTQTAIVCWHGDNTTFIKHHLFKSSRALIEARYLNGGVNICILYTAANPKSAGCFSEIAEALAATIGEKASIVMGTIPGHGTNIVLGWNIAKDSSLTPGCILYNLEQLSVWDDQHPEEPGLTERLVKLSKTCEIWDYSLRNIEILQGAGGNATHVPLGYHPVLNRIQPAEVQDIDVLFYGSFNEHRRLLMQDMLRHGIRVMALFGVYGKERDKWISRAKIVLNPHFYENGSLEMVRIVYLLANGKCVVSEPASDMPKDLPVMFSDDPVKTCQEILQMPDFFFKTYLTGDWNEANPQKLPLLAF